VVVSLASPLPLLAPRHRRLAFARLVHHDLLRPALLAAEALVSPIHVDVLAGAEVPSAEGAGLEEAARHAGVARGGRGARPHHLLQYDARRRVRVPAMAVVVVVHQDLEPHDEALAIARAPGVGSGHGCADDADAVVVDGGGATLLPEVEDALPSREHGGEVWGGEEGGGRRGREGSPHLLT